MDVAKVSMQQTVCQLENYNDSHTAAAPGKWYISGFPIEQIRKSVRIEKLQPGWIGGWGGKTLITWKTCRLLPAPSIEYFVFNVINV